MSNTDVAVGGQATFDVALADSLVNAIDSLADRMSVQGVQFVKFKQGEWLIGKNQDTFPENKFEGVPNLPELAHGWMCWKDGVPVDEHWVKIGTELPSKATLPDHGPYSQDNDGWSENFRFDIKILAAHGVPEEINAQFTTSSKGGQSAIGRMMKQWVLDCKNGTASGGVPVVLFDVDSYQNKKYGGKTMIPIMTISRYVPIESVSSSPAAQTEDEFFEADTTAQTGKPDLE